jgi:mRNA interferase RelE/StbE
VYEVYLERSAENDLKRLPATTFHRVLSVLETLAKNPRPSGCRKLAGSKSDWRIRIGDYRIIYEIDEKAKAVRIMRVRHRREVYRR